MAKRAATEEEFQKREAVGIIRASRFVRSYAKSHKQISVDTICEIHRQIFRDAWPEIAGVYRTENITIKHSKHRPPHYSQAPLLMNEFDRNLKSNLEDLEGVEGKILNIQKAEDNALEAIDKVLSLAAWIHHQIAYIHPFREGNGRTARLVANLILERYGLPGISVRIEKENKNRYLKALSQIDREGDFEPLLDLMVEGILERYRGVAMKYYEYGRSKKNRR